MYIAGLPDDGPNIHWYNATPLLFIIQHTPRILKNQQAFPMTSTGMSSKINRMNNI